MKFILSVMLMFGLSGCITGENVSYIEPGMTKSQVKKVMGKPDGYRSYGKYEVLKYANRLLSGWSWDRTDYSFVFKDNLLIQYGPGEIRERNVGGIHTIFITKNEKNCPE